MVTVRLYHGTAHEFEAFDGRFALRGSEPNSALGIHLSEYPGTAAGYADLAARDTHGSRPRVLVLDVEIARAAVLSSAEQFLGRRLDAPFEAQEVTREEFVAARHRLEAEGFHAVVVDSPVEGLCGTWTVFDPACIRIIAEMSVEEAEDMDSDGAEWDGVEMVNVDLSEDLALAEPSKSPAT